MPDEDSFRATAVVLELTRDLLPTDTVLLLLSGGGSALFEQLLIPAEELQDITRQLLASGADIVEMNTIRKQLSRVKGGRVALHCAPARVEAVVLSDILGDPLDMIASGPAAADPSTAEQARAIAEKYALKLSETAWACLDVETPKALDNVRTQIIGSVRELCRAAAERCRELGYEPILLTDRLDCEAREAGRFLTAILRTHAGEGRRLAFLAGGETVVHLTGTGPGGRNQELTLAAAPGLDGLASAALISVGSDGTDGSTDAAGGYADGDTLTAGLKASRFCMPGGSGGPPTLFPPLMGCQTRDLLEGLGEVATGAKLELLGDVSDGIIGSCQQHLGLLHPGEFYIVVQINPHLLLELSGEIVVPISHQRCQLLQGDRFLQMDVDIVAAKLDLLGAVGVGPVLVDAPDEIHIHLMIDGDKLRYRLALGHALDVGVPQGVSGFRG